MGVYNNLSEETIFEQFLNQEGRLNRWRYFKRIFVLGLVEVVINAVMGIFLMNEGKVPTTPSHFAYIVVGLIFLYPQFCLVLRRVKDMDKPLWLAKLSVVFSGVCIVCFNYDVTLAASPLGQGLAIASGVLGLYILFAKGTKGDNQYGPDPLG